MKSLVTVSVLVAIMVCAAVPGRADTVTVDENGHGFFTPTGGTPQPLPVVASPFGSQFLAYQLPFNVTEGNVAIFPGPPFPSADAFCPNTANPTALSGACDIISFFGNTLTFVSDNVDGSNSLADTDISSFAGATGLVPTDGVNEIGPEGNNSASYNATGGPSNAGAPVSGGTIAYTFISDGTATSPIPEPTSLLLLGSGLAGLAGWRRWRKAA